MHDLGGEGDDPLMTNALFSLRPSVRLALIFLLSLALHAVILFGLGFTWQTEPNRRMPPVIEITLAHWPQETPPQNFDFLAQASQSRGGQVKRKSKAQKRQPTSSLPPAARAKSPPQQASAISSGSNDSQSTPASRLLNDLNHLTMRDVLETSRRVAAAMAFSNGMASASADHPSVRRIDAQTQAYAAAAYLRQWVAKVERIGNLNYPREALEKDLSGQLLLEVTLRPDGSVYSIDVLVPSPFDILNQAAKRIVKLGAPYAKVPKAVLQGHDLLVITRRWEFDDASGFYPH